MSDIHQTIQANEEAALLRQNAESQAQQAQAYRQRKQVWKTIRQGDKWVRVPESSLGDSSGAPQYRTVKVDGRWQRVPC